MPTPSVAVLVPQRLEPKRDGRALAKDGDSCVACNDWRSREELERLSHALQRVRAAWLKGPRKTARKPCYVGGDEHFTWRGAVGDSECDRDCESEQVMADNLRLSCSK